MNVTDVVGVPFRWGSAIRRRRIFHPGGVLAGGGVERIAPESTGLPLPSAPVVARVSKAAGTPGPLPDAAGLAFRIPAQQGWPSDWDILLASAGSGIVSRVIGLHPVAGWTGTPLTSLAPLTYRGTKWWLRARIVTPVDGAGLRLADIRRQLEHGSLTVELDQARATSPFEPLARLTLNDLRIGDDVSFDPVLNSAPGVALYPRWLAWLRAGAYGQSRGGRDARHGVPTRN